MIADAMIDACGPRSLAELERSDARLEQFDIDSALAKAISVLNNASALWIDASLEELRGELEALVPVRGHAKEGDTENVEFVGTTIATAMTT